MATLVYLSLFGMALANLTADCQLASDEGRRQLRSVTFIHIIPDLRTVFICMDRVNWII